MQNSCLLFSPASFTPLCLLPNPIRVEVPFRNRTRSSSATTSWTNILNCSISSRVVLPPPHGTVVEELVETSIDESEFVEVGYICKVHGLQGELRVKPNTDFPELRFAQPGRRWLKQQHLGKEIIREVELVEGRDHPGQKSWIVSFNGIDTVDKAKQLIGSSLLVLEEERPVLEEGEFYTRDLVGMKVILKETDQLVGTVVNVFNSGGANDLLQVRLNPTEEALDESGLPESGAGVSGHLAWVPFVEAIVPDVDMNKKEMKITPPKGLLELNRRSDLRSKKERRQQEWKERKKATRHLIVAKKKLSEMEQKHIFHGLRFGEKAQRSLLADHIVNINFKLFQQAMQNFETVSIRWDLSEFVKDDSTKLLENPTTISKESLLSIGTKVNIDATEKMRRKGLKIISEGKAALVLIVNDEDEDNSFAKIGERGLLPLITVSSSQESLKKSFSDHDYFGIEPDMVWFLEEAKLPVISSSVDEQNKHKVLMKSPWEILQSPVGSGGIFSILSSKSTLENLSEMGIEYVQVCNLGERSIIGNPIFFGLVKSRKAEIGIQICNSSKGGEDFNMIFSMKFLKKMIKEMDKLKFHAIPKQNSHVEMVDKEWVDVVPSLPNSYEFHCSIYSTLSVSSPDKICVMEVTSS